VIAGLLESDASLFKKALGIDNIREFAENPTKNRFFPS
jgi:hypothetical protein